MHAVVRLHPLPRNHCSTKRATALSIFTRSRTFGLRSTGRTPGSDPGNGSSTLSARTAADCRTGASTVPRADAHSGTPATRCGRGMTNESTSTRRTYASTRHSCVAGLRARLKTERFWFDSRGWHVPRRRMRRSPRHCLRSSKAEQPVLTRKCVGSSPTGGTIASQRG